MDCHPYTPCTKCTALLDKITNQRLLDKKAISPPSNTTPLCLQTGLNLRTTYMLECNETELAASIHDALQKHIWKNRTEPIIFHVKASKPRGQLSGVVTTPVFIMTDVPGDIAVTSDMLANVMLDLPCLHEAPEMEWRRHVPSLELEHVNEFRLKWFVEHTIPGERGSMYAKFRSVEPVEAVAGAPGPATARDKKRTRKDWELDCYIPGAGMRGNVYDLPFSPRQLERGLEWAPFGV
ncbi:hypothetical protein BDV06DRAFT_222238 [Aspergillus oleicola]